MRTKLSSFVLFLLCIALLFTSCDSTAAQPTSSNGSTSSTGGGATGGNTPKVLPTEVDPNISKAQQILKGMTLQQKLGQLIMVEYTGSDYVGSGLQQMIAQQYVGGYLYQPINGNFNYPANSVQGAKAFAQQAQADAKIPLLIAIDQEGGQVSKIDPLYGSTTISAQQMAQSGNPNVAQQQGQQDAQKLNDLGINVNLAPVVDVQSVDNPLLQDRIFGNNPQTVSTYAGAFLNGLQNNKIIGTLKHFPGLGSLTTDQDPHSTLPVVNRSLTDLTNTDLAPYKTLIQQDNPAMIMSTDVIDTAIDPNLPAELSPKAINGTLRKTLGYDGVVITDGIYMGGITAKWTVPQASTLAIEAGCDIVEGPLSVQSVADVIASLQQAIQNGQLSQAQVDQSVQRILLMKMRYGLIK